MKKLSFYIIIFLNILLSIFIITIFSFIFLYIFMKDFQKIFLIIGFILIFFFIIFWLTKGLRMKLGLRIFDKQKKGKFLFKLNVDSNFEILQGENIIIPLTPCLYIHRSPINYAENIRDIIVTNKRILIGFYTSIPPYKKKLFQEIFGVLNFWHPKIQNIPLMEKNIPFIGKLFRSKIIRRLMVGDFKIKDVFYELDSKRGPGVIMQILLWKIPIYYSIYHPRAREIYDFFKHKYLQN